MLNGFLENSSRRICLDKHVTAVSPKCFFQLHQQRRVRRSLDDVFVATIVHAFLTSQIDCCNGLLAGAPKVVTDKLQRVMNSVARIVTSTRKFDHGLTHVWHDTLHWLDVPERVTFKLCMTVCKCLHGIRGHRHLRSTDRGQLVVPRYVNDDRWQKGVPLCWSVCMELSSCINWKTKRLPWTLFSVRLNVFCSPRTDTAHGAH